MRLEEARELLDKLADPKTPPVQEGGDEDKKGKPGKGKEDEDEGNGAEVLWKLASTASNDYQWIFVKTDKDEKIIAIYGYCWAGKSIPFDRIGDVAKAPYHAADEIAWDSLKPHIHYRIVATGSKERASQVTVSVMTPQTFGVHQAGADSAD